MSINFDNQMGIYKETCSNLILSDDARIRIKKMECDSIKRTNVGKRIIMFNVIAAIALILLAPVSVFAGYKVTLEIKTWIDEGKMLYKAPDRQLSSEQISTETCELLNLVLKSPDILILSGRLDSVPGEKLSDRYEVYYSGFNGIREFEERSDAASVLLDRLVEIVEAGLIDEFYPNGENLLLLLSLDIYNSRLTKEEFAKYKQILETDLVLQFYGNASLIPRAD